MTEDTLRDLGNMEFFFSSTDTIKQNLSPFDDMLFSVCPAGAALSSLVQLNFELEGRTFNDIPEISELGHFYFPAVEHFYRNTSVYEIFLNPLARELLLSSRKTASILRPVISERPDVVYLCALAHRHVASTRTLVEKYPGELEIVSRLIPLGERLRDLGISRKLCGVETATTVAALTRSFAQIAAGHFACEQLSLALSDFRPLLDLIDKYRSGEASLRLHAMLSPFFDLLQSLDTVFSRRAKREVAPTSLLKPRERIVEQHISGFACGDAPVQSRETCDGEDSGIWSDRCEIADVISAFESEDVDLKKIDSTHRRPWLFLQSINANWHAHLLADSRGLRISAAFDSLAEKARASGLKPRRNPKHCRDKETVEFLDWVERQYLPKDKTKVVDFASAFARALQAIAEVNPDCSSALAVGYMTALDVVSEMLSRPVCYETQPLLSQVAKEDLATVTEIVWQTIAGEKLSDLLTHRGGLFQLMRRYWARL